MQRIDIAIDRTDETQREHRVTGGEVKDLVKRLGGLVRRTEVRWKGGEVWSYIMMTTFERPYDVEWLRENISSTMPFAGHIREV